MSKHPLLPCPKCMTSLIERGLLYPGGKVVARELAPRSAGAPIGVQYECTRCGSATALAIPSSPRRAG